MGSISKILSGTGILIGMYLILARSSSAVSIINSLGGVYTNSITALQGRK